MIMMPFPSSNAGAIGVKAGRKWGNRRQRDRRIRPDPCALSGRRCLLTRQSQV